jgi:hypothetical protein
LSVSISGGESTGKEFETNSESEDGLGRTKQPSEVGCNKLKAYGNILSWKITSLEMKRDLVCKSKIIYPLTPKGYPKNKQDLAQGSNFVRE